MWPSAQSAVSGVVDRARPCFLCAARGAAGRMRLVRPPLALRGAARRGACHLPVADPSWALSLISIAEHATHRRAAHSSARLCSGLCAGAACGVGAVCFAVS